MKTVFNINLDFDLSKGSYLYDKNSKSYFLDFFSMFSSLPLGYNHEIFDSLFYKKINAISSLRMANNLFRTDEMENFIDEFKSIAFHKNLHFCSTGALAFESAVKCAYEYYKNPNAIVLGLKNNFHGINSWGFLTDRNLSSVKNRMIHFPKNNWELHDIDNLINIISQDQQKVACVVIEPIQCTAGDIYIDEKKLLTLQKVCKEKEICFIVDEVQTGFGSTGEMWYSKKIGLNPDIIIFGKKSQICGIMVNDKFSEAIYSDYRKLEVTFDGDLIDAVRSTFIIKAIKSLNLLDKVKANSELIRSQLDKYFINYRSSGHLIAFDFENKMQRDKFCSVAYEEKLLVNPTMDISVRLRPNLAITIREIDDFLSKVHKIVKKI